MARAPKLDKWLTTAQACIALDCTKTNVWSLISRKKLPHAVKCGNSFLIPKSDIEARLKFLSTHGGKRGRKRRIDDLQVA